MRAFLFLLLVYLYGEVGATFVARPENTFNRGNIGYRNLLLDPHSASLYVGTRGKLFRLWAYNVNDTSENLFAERDLSASAAESAECRAAGNAAPDCEASTRFFALQHQRESLFVCSSVAMKPEIRVLDALTLKDRTEARTEIGICSPDANVNATTLIVEWGNPKQQPAVYSGIRTGMAGENHLIYRPPLIDEDNKEVIASMRTIYTDNTWLNEPQFVGSFDVGDFVYFFFREVAVEASGQDRTVYSRVGRICKKDVGGRAVLRQVWTSFVKARLNCSISALFPFYFDHIQFVSRVDISDDTLFYASMSTSDTAFVSSAVCVFSLKAIDQLFHHGLFLEQSGSSWQPVQPDAVPQHRPGTCVSNSQALSDSDLHFARSHLLMSQPVSGNEPILQLRDVTFSHILVDARAEQNVIFALSGRDATLWKVSHWGEGATWKWKLIQKVQLNTATPIRAAALLPAEFLYTASDSGVGQFSLSVCSQHFACSRCSVDPYCSWSVSRSACFPREKVHGQSVGWISSWAGRGSSECTAAAKPTVISVLPGDTLTLKCEVGAAWKFDGHDLPSNWQQHRSTDGSLLLLDVQKEHAGTYECIVDGNVSLIKYSVTMDEEECVRPRTVSAYSSCQREWCRQLQHWTQLKRNVAQCAANDTYKRIN